MNDGVTPARRIYAWKSGFTLTSANLDIPVNSKEPLVWLNIANNTTISGGVSAATGTDVTVRNNGVGPDLIVHYGDAESFPLLDCSWVRIFGNTANVTFYLSDEYIPIRPRPTWGGTTGVTSLTSPNAGLTVAPSSGAVVITLGELDFGTLAGAAFSMGALVNGQVLQYNGTNWVNAALTAGVSSVSNSDSTLTISPTTGAVVASLALGHANTWTALQTFGNNISLGGAQLNVAALATGQLIAYNGTNWINLGPTISTANAGNSSTTLNTVQMGGLGLRLTADAFGVIDVQVFGNVVFPAVGSTTVQIRGIFFGTGTSPAFGDAATGTLMQTIKNVNLTNGSVAGAEAFSFGYGCSGLRSGFTPGTTYWFDIQFTVSTATATTINVNGTAKTVH